MDAVITPDAELLVPEYWRYSAFGYDKRRAALDAVDICSTFCRLNDIPVPEFRVHESGCDSGWYSARRVNVVWRGCVLPAKSGWSWSWPGYKADRTIAGVIAHELGHHVQAVCGSRATRKLFVSLRRIEKPIGSYAATKPDEDMAETTKVYVLNPSLLAVIAPERYRAMTEWLTPVISADWREVLKGSERHLRCVERRVR